MKIYNRVVLDMETLEVLEEDSFDYQGPVAMCGGGKSPDIPDPPEPPEPPEPRREQDKKSGEPRRVHDKRPEGKKEPLKPRADDDDRKRRARGVSRLRVPLRGEGGTEGGGRAGVGVPK